MPQSLPLLDPAGTTGRSAGEWPASLLWVNVRLLHPLIGGDRIRTYQMLRHLKRRCRIRYVCPVTPNDSQEAVDRAAEYCDELITYPHSLVRSGSPRFYAEALANSLFGTRPFSCEKYATSAATAVLDRLLASPPQDEIVVADYLMSFIHFAGRLNVSAPPVVVFQHNLESLIWDRHVEAARNPLRKFICRRERDLTRSFEGQVAREAAGQIAVSAEEADAFRINRGMRNVLGWVPTGVDCEYFQPPRHHDGSRTTLAFLGSMDWHANVDAVQHFVAGIYPAIKRAEPQTRLLLIGRHPAPAVRALAASDPSIEVTGTVDDVRPWLAKAQVMILPLRVGGGTRIKVFEGMAAGLAVVSTSVGVEGLPVRHEEHALIADTDVEFAGSVIRLLQREDDRARLAQNARAWVAANFSWESAAARFLDLCGQVLSHRTDRAARAEANEPEIHE